MKNEIAFLMAAGLGSRMAPLTQKTPKPLIKVFNKPIIETIIEALMCRDVKHIYIIVGYLKEQFSYLCDKYSNVSLIENAEYQTINNISSIHAVTSLMGNEDCFICESDCLVTDPDYFNVELTQSCYFGKMVEGHSDDWVFDQDDTGRITRIGKIGESCYNMCGTAWFTAKDAKHIATKINEIYTHPGKYENLFWDEIVNNELSVVSMTVLPISPSQTVEIDTVEELLSVDPNCLEYN